MNSGRGTQGWIGNINKENTPGAQVTGAYHFGSAANMKWSITVTEPSYSSSRRNNGYKLQYAEVTKTGDSLTIGEFDSPVISENGSWPDIHEFNATISVQSGFEPPLPVNFNIVQIDGQLFVTTVFPVKCSVELYDLKGVRKCESVQSYSSRVVLSVNGFPTGLYVLRITHERRSIRKKVTHR